MSREEKVNKKNSKKQQHTSKASPQAPKRTHIWAFFCFAFAFVLYSNTLKHSYVLDDYSALADNWVIKKGVEGIPVILTTTYRYGVNHLTDNIYRPLSQVMFAVEWQISPDNPYLSHFLNVFFYALSCLLLFLVLIKYLKKSNPVIPLIITLLYAAHPIHTEVVANIKSRDEIMSFFFLLTTLFFLHNWFIKKSWWSLAVSMLTFFLSLLSKEGTVTMLFLIPILGWYFTDSKTKEILTGSALLILPALIYIAIRQQIISKFGGTAEVPVVDNFLAAAPDAITHFATAIMLLGKYLFLLVIPYQLVSDYSFNQIPLVGIGDAKFMLSFLVYLSAGIYVIANFRKKTLLVFGLLFFLITISIYSNILVPVGTSFAERLMFLPSLGVCIAFTSLLARLLRIEPDNNNRPMLEPLRLKPYFTVACVLILTVFSFKTVTRAAEWKNQNTLFGKDVKHSPNSAHMRVYWGLTLRDNALKEKNPADRDAIMRQAVTQFDKALSIYPSYADCYEQLGLAWYRLKDSPKSLQNYDKALKLNPNKAVTWNNTGIIYFEQGNIQKAAEVYSKALSIDPNYADAHCNMGSVLGTTGKYKEAIAEFKKCIQFDPQSIKAHQYMGVTYQNMNQPDSAKYWFAKVAILEQQKVNQEVKFKK